MNKRILSSLLAFVMILSCVATVVPVYASETVQFKITASDTSLKAGDTVDFTVTLGAVSNMGVLEFNLNIPEGLKILDSTVKVPDGLAAVIDSDGAIVVPSKTNGYKWSYSAQSTGYAGTEDLVLLTFSCEIEDTCSAGTKNVNIVVADFYTNDLDELGYAVTPATVNVTAGESEPVKYTVTVTNDGHGTASASHNTAEAGTEVTLTANAAAGYEFDKWVSADVTVTGNKFIMPAKNVSVKATFKEKTVLGTANFKVTADNTAPKAGDTVNFTVTLSETGNMGVLEFNLSIPEGLKVVDSTVKIPDGLETVIDSDGAIVVPTKANGYKWSYSAQSTGYVGTGDLVLLTFSCKVEDTCSAGVKNVGVVVADFYTNDLGEIAYTVTPATVNVTAAGGEVLLGDVTQDGKINIGDVDRLYRYVMGYVELDVNQKKAADVTQDGRINIGDVDKLYRYVMGYIETLG